MNWPLWGGLLAMLLLAKHAWVLFAPAERAIPSTAETPRSAQAEQLFGSVAASTPASLGGIRPIGIFAGKHGFAVLQTESGQVGVAVGGQVVPGVRLVETHADYVILERGGMRQRADLSKAPAAGGVTPVADTTPPRNDAAPAPARAFDQLTPEQREISQQQQKELLRGRH